MKKAESANIKEMSKESENFICIDEYGLMYSFCVENSTIKEGGKLLPEEGLLNNLSSLAVKKDVVIFGDTEGNLTKWNAKDKHSSLMAKKHSSIKQNNNMDILKTTINAAREKERERDSKSA